MRPASTFSTIQLSNPRHMKFGEGLVTGITEGGRDYEVTVQFDTAGVKKMFATFAKLQKV